VYSDLSGFVVFFILRQQAAEMTLQARIFHCQIDTPDGPVLDGDIVSIKLPLHDGYMGIFANHAPVTAVLGTGLVSLALPAGQARKLFLSRGFLRFADNALAILAEECMPVEKLDMEAAWNLLQRAYKMPRDTDEQRALRDEAIAAGRIRFALVPKTDDKTVSLAEAMSKGL